MRHEQRCEWDKGRDCSHVAALVATSFKVPSGACQPGSVHFAFPKLHVLPGAGSLAGRSCPLTSQERARMKGMKGSGCAFPATGESLSFTSSRPSSHRFLPSPAHETIAFFTGYSGLHRVTISGPILVCAVRHHG